MTWFSGLLRNRVIVKVTLASFLFLAISVFKTYPLILHFNTHIPVSIDAPGDLRDPLLNAWILAWGFHAFTTDPLNLFNANIFYPVENALAFSEHLIGVLPIFAPAYAVTGNPIFAYNVVFFLSFALSGVTMFLLVHYWTQSFWASLISGFLFAFGPIRIAQIAQLQLLNLYWAPLALLFLEKFLRSKRWRDLAGFTIFYWLQVLSSVYLGWFTTIAVALYLLYFILFIDRGLLSRSMIPQYATFITLSLLILLPIHLPYYEVKQQWGFSRSLQECVIYSPDLLRHYLSVPPLLNNNTHLGKWLFPYSAVPLLVAASSSSMGGFLLPDTAKRMKRIFWLILVSSFLLSLGPFLVLNGRNTRIPLPYLLFYHLVPGFQAMRAPVRFSMMAALAASVLAALGILGASSSLNTRLGFRRLTLPAWQAVLALSCLGLFTLELGFKPLPLARIQTDDGIPKVYRWLAARQLKGPIVELPHGEKWDAQYTYFSTYHWLPIVNGYSGFIPPTYSQIASELDALPSRKAVEFLSAIGVKGLVLHTDRLQPYEVLQWRQAKLAEMGLEKVAEFGSDIVYKIASRTLGFYHFE